MKLTLAPHSEKKDRWTILIEDEPWKEVHLFIFGRHPSFPEQIASLAAWQVEFDELEYQQAKRYVLKRLGSQSYLSCQLKKLLIERCVQAQTIERLMQECQERGYLNDQAWLDSFMQSQLKRVSKRALLAKLHAKGVPSSLIQEIASQYSDPDEELESIARLLRVRYRSKDLSEPKEKQKAIAALMRKGYAFNLIKQALDNVRLDLND